MRVHGVMGSKCDESGWNSDTVIETPLKKKGKVIRNNQSNVERWNDMYGRFLEYRTKYQSIPVVEFEDDSRLGCWVNTQRKTYRNKSLSAERIDRLNSIEFIWDANARWTEMYEQLVAYKNQYKSTCVPRTYKADPQLARWVSTQRGAYNHTNRSLITTDRIEQLNSIGFVWNPLDAQWMDMYERLVEYKNQYKSTSVPQSYKADPQLASWVSTQRKRYNTLTVERKDQLNSIGFVWNAYDERWTEMYERLVAYKNQYKSTCVPRSYKADPQLAIWVLNQRGAYNHTHRLLLTTDRIEQLNSIDFIWDAKK